LSTLVDLVVVSLMPSVPTVAVAPPILVTPVVVLCLTIEHGRWVEPLAGHLVKRNYSEPHWEKSQAAVMALEKVTLYGVPIVTARKVNYGRIDPELSRDLFIRNALVEGDWETHHKFFHANRRLLEEVGELEERARRRCLELEQKGMP
jgi:ATP-dependent helicase HrpA